MLPAIQKFASAVLPASAYRAARAGYYRVDALRRWAVTGGGICDVQGVRLAVDVPGIAPTIAADMMSGQYEHAEAELVRGLLRPDDVVLEIGAGVGFMASLSAKIVGSDRVWSFEGNPDLEPIARRNFALNGVAPRYEVAFLAGEDGVQDFYKDIRFVGSSMVPIPGVTPVGVRKRAIRPVMEELRPTVIVMDIEGFEIDIFDLFDLDGVRAIVMERHPRITGVEAIEGMDARLAAQGFEITRTASGLRVAQYERSVAAPRRA